jgi:hypothetical protein
MRFRHNLRDTTQLGPLHGPSAVCGNYPLTLRGGNESSALADVCPTQHQPSGKLCHPCQAGRPQYMFSRTRDKQPRCADSPKYTSRRHMDGTLLSRASSSRVSRGSETPQQIAARVLTCLHSLHREILQFNRTLLSCRLWAHSTCFSL